MISAGDFLEYNNYVGNYYGTPRKYVEDFLEKGKDVILEIDVNGGRQVREKFPDAVSVFVVTPGALELEKRLTGRGTESADVVKKRLTQAVNEVPDALMYDFIIINDDLDKTTEHINRLIQDQHMKSCMQSGFINNFKGDLVKLLKEKY